MDEIQRCKGFFPGFSMFLWSYNLILDQISKHTVFLYSCLLVLNAILFLLIQSVMYFHVIIQDCHWLLQSNAFNLCSLYLKHLHTHNLNQKTCLWHQQTKAVLLWDWVTQLSTPIMISKTLLTSQHATADCISNYLLWTIMSVIAKAPPMVLSARLKHFIAGSTHLVSAVQPISCK